MYTHFVKTGIITLERLEELLAVAPRRRFGLPIPECDLSVWRVDEEFTVDPEEFLSLGRATPFDGMRLCGRNVATFKDGRIIYTDNKTEE